MKSLLARTAHLLKVVRLLAAIPLLLAPCVAERSKWESTIAVKRGQKQVDPAILPLVCLEIGTIGVAWPIDTITFEDMDSHALVREELANPSITAHPDMLTAAAPNSVSLSLPILQLKPGRYRIHHVRLLTDVFRTVEFQLSSGEAYWFEVKPNCVNYVGGIHLETDWDALNREFKRAEKYTVTAKATYPIRALARDTAKRDVKWACHEIPGMIPLPMAISLLQTSAQP
jgi:hypothetical protein